MDRLSTRTDDVDTPSQMALHCDKVEVLKTSHTEDMLAKSEMMV